ncbi:MAG TPA: CHC2 zinc finger domain-containing protein, partial [Saprospiraceae bacterium]|nr:CHC2 zinc finger domain-containing protein [Saprospiraceae bacterium]
MISQKSIDEIIDTARIEEVVGDFVTLKRRGINFIGLCPFHNEKTPSFNVNPARNIFKCFGCGQGGDSVQFIMEHDGM